MATNYLAASPDA